MPAKNVAAGDKDKDSYTDQGRNLDATSRCDFSWLLFVGKKWSLLYRHFRSYHNFCIKQGLFKEEKNLYQSSNEWLPN